MNPITTPAIIFLVCLCGNVLTVTEPRNEMSGTLQYYPDSVAADGTVRAAYRKTVFVLEPEDFRRATVRALLALPAGEPALDLLCASFDLDSRQWEYEYALRDALCGMWLRFQKLDARFWHASQTEAEGHAIKEMIFFINTN